MLLGCPLWRKKIDKSWKITFLFDNFLIIRKGFNNNKQGSLLSLKQIIKLNWIDLGIFQNQL